MEQELCKGSKREFETAVIVNGKLIHMVQKGNTTIPCPECGVQLSRTFEYMGDNRFFEIIPDHRPSGIAVVKVEKPVVYPEIPPAPVIPIQQVPVKPIEPVKVVIKPQPIDFPITSGEVPKMDINPIKPIVTTTGPTERLADTGVTNSNPVNKAVQELKTASHRIVEMSKSEEPKIAAHNVEAIEASKPIVKPPKKRGFFDKLLGR